MNSKAWISTYTGKKFHVLSPHEDEIRIEDIAHALSLQCRFTGHVKSFYSVAQHSVLVSQLCDPKDALYGLLHDATEAYIGDMSAPLKHTSEMSRFRAAEAAVMVAIANKFRVPLTEPLSVKQTDKRLLLTEARDLGLDVTGWYKEYQPFELTIIPLSSALAEYKFLKRFQELTAAPVSARLSRFDAPAICQADGWVDQEADVHVGA